MEAWIIDNWQYLFVAFFVVEKIVKITPTKYDDILVDVVWKTLKKIVGK